ncbi:hypothetical protein MAR_036672 [Mya arenaria]|uniref:Uncharacterized protein n=1 Tax=Mya arenaria TaxID=6604 RepID=A0ABY7FQK0_MYAAR|nr:hypothetical protein MAR_036672 [Mya arenaria]
MEITPGSSGRQRVSVPLAASERHRQLANLYVWRAWKGSALCLDEIENVLVVTGSSMLKKPGSPINANVSKRCLAQRRRMENSSSIASVISVNITTPCWIAGKALLVAATTDFSIVFSGDDTSQLATLYVWWAWEGSALCLDEIENVLVVIGSSMLKKFRSPINANVIKRSNSFVCSRHQKAGIFLRPASVA